MSDNLYQPISGTDFSFPGQTNCYHGKVRDVYSIGKLLATIATDRISAFDVILPEAIPYKGQVLNQLSAFFLESTQTIVPNWFLSSPDPNVTIGKKCTPLKVEVVVRGYLAGHAWRTYKQGLRTLCGETLPEGLHENDPLPKPILTPTTKADQGHDEDISKAEIIASGRVEKAIYEKVEAYALALFEFGSAHARKQNLILVDTKYEFGMDGNEILLIDEIHTPDSSRYFYANDYEYRQKSKQPQIQLSKEFVRNWLIENNFQGKEGQQIPIMEPDFISEITNRYIQLYEILTGKKFIKSLEEPKNRILRNINSYLQTFEENN